MAAMVTSTNLLKVPDTLDHRERRICVVVLCAGPGPRSKNTAVVDTRDVKAPKSPGLARFLELCYHTEKMCSVDYHS